MCILRVTATRATLRDFLASASIPYYDSWDVGSIPKWGRDKGKPSSDSGFKSDVSSKDWNDLPGQIDDAIEFLRRHHSDLRRLRDERGIDDVRLDFPYHLRIGINNVVVQFDYLPPALITLAGQLGIGIELSLWPPGAPNEERSAGAEPGALPNAGGVEAPPPSVS